MSGKKNQQSNSKGTHDKRKAKRGKTAAKPKLALREKGNVQVLVKDLSAKGHLAPLSQEQKDKNYPGLDACKAKKAAKRLKLDAGWNTIPLDESKTDKKRKATLRGKRKNKRGKQRAKHIPRFFSLPEAMQSKRTGYLILFAAMLARLQGFLPETLPMIHAIHLGAPPAMPPELLIILEAINGPQKVKSTNYTLRRPFYLAPIRDSISSSTPSSSPYTYFGGKLKSTAYCGKTFWLPLWNRAIAIGDGLPGPVRSIAVDAASIIPIFCDGTKKSNHGLELNADDLTVEDTKLLKSLKNHKLLINAVFRSFLQSLSKAPKRGKAVFASINKYLPKRHIKGGGVCHPSLEEYLIAEGLCIYSAFLDHISRQKWLPKKKCEALFTAARECFLHEENNRALIEAGATIGDWRERDTFIRFLVGYLRGNTTRIKLDGTPCSADTIAAIHMLKDEKQKKVQMFILPYKPVLDAYKVYLSEYDVQPDWTDASFYRVAKAWSIKGFKTGSRGGRDPWKHAFYRAGNLPESVTNPNVNCFGFAVEELPDEIKQILADLQAEQITDAQKEVGGND